MKYASDFRRIARESLRGRWFLAVLAGVIAMLLGATNADIFKINFSFDQGSAGMSFTVFNQQIYSTREGLVLHLGMYFGLILIALLVLGMVYYVLGRVVAVGHSQFHLELVDRGEEPKLNTLFSCFPRWKTIVAANLLQVLYVFLWSLLFIFPGIMAIYSYAMTDYILAENPQLTAGEAITRSREMMYGNRLRLFCLQLSFIGWSILAGLTGGIGNLWLNPYEQAATAAFYREISGTERKPEESV